jgi:hypothetical protein
MLSKLAIKLTAAREQIAEHWKLIATSWWLVRRTEDNEATICVRVKDRRLLNWELFCNIKVVSGLMNSKQLKIPFNNG